MKTSRWLVAVAGLVLAALTIRDLAAQQGVAEGESDVATHMHEHLARITTIKSFIIMGNMDGIREPAVWLANHEAVAGLPENYEPYVDQMRRYAREVNNARDFESAAMAVSDMARTCADCHLVNEIEIEFGYDQVPAEWSDTVSHMQRHQWAADRLWEGLVAPSDAAWNRGADMLIDVPLHPDDVIAGDSAELDPAGLDRIARRLHVLAGRGTNVTTPAGRSELYGEMLGLCAECHSRLGRGPGQ